MSWSNICYKSSKSKIFYFWVVFTIVIQTKKQPTIAVKNMKIVTKSFNDWKNLSAEICQELNKLNNNDD